MTPKQLKMLPEILNLEGHQNRCIGSKVPTILLNGWMFPTGGASLGRVCAAACAAGLFLPADRLIWTEI